MAKKKARKAVTRKPKPKKSAARKLTKDGGPQGWPTLSSYMVVKNAAASVVFYQTAFGFRLESKPMKDDSGTVVHAGMRLGDAAIMFGPQGMSPEMRPPVATGAVDALSLYIYVPNVDALAARALRAGVSALQAPSDQPWGDRVATFRDPDGYHWTFATHRSG